MWGDGVVTRSAATFHYPCSWDTVSEEELVFLLPSLRAHPGIASLEYGPAYYLRRALSARIRDSVNRAGLLAQSDRSASGLDMSEIIARSGVLKDGADPSQWAEDNDWRHFYRNSQFIRHRAGPSCTKGRVWESPGDFLLFELYVLYCLNRVLRDAEAVAMSAPREPAAPADLDLALTASIYSSFNAAYVYPQLEFAHELLAVGGWLGYLVRGRPALMPIFVATHLIELLSRKPVEAADPAAQCDALIHFHAELAAGVPRLLKRARQVRDAGYPLAVRPSRGWALGPVRPQVWDEACADDLKARIGFDCCPLEAT
jgi:hypothetical protein